MRRLLGQRSNADSSSQDANISATSSPIAASYRPSAAQTAVFNANAPIRCLDASPDGTSAVLGSQHLLKIVAFRDGLTIREVTDLRALIAAQPSTRAGSSSISDQLSIKEAKWATAQGRPAILTACANGKIFQYDVHRAGIVGPGAGLNPIQIREDSRHINTLDISPHRDTYLLSGSQDGIVRFFDIRTPIRTTNGMTFRSQGAFKCHADAVRQVKWSIKDGFFFASSTEQGVILKWDSRKHSAPVLRINGHEKPCTSIAWHPDGNHLISGGWDLKCYVWDLSKHDRRQKPKHTISTPAPVGVVAWRPGLWSATAQGKRAAQVAVSYDDSSRGRYGIDSVHIWDLARPTIPFKEVNRFDIAPASLLWHNHDLLWTAGKDGFFTQCDIAFTPRVIDRHSLSSNAFSPRGDVVMFLDERASVPCPRHPVAAPVPDKQALPSYSSGSTAPMLSISKSDSEDDVVNGFLGPRRRATRQRRESTRSSHQLSTTPPSVTGTGDAILSLDQGIKAAGVYKNYQALSVGHVPGAPNVNVFQYLAATYFEAVESDLPAKDGYGDLKARILGILEKYARAAEDVTQFRLAQTWRILAYAVTLMLNSRAEFHLVIRRQHFLKRKKTLEQKRETGIELNSSTLLPDRSADEEENPEEPGSISWRNRGSHSSHKSLLSEEIDSTSNITTPMARSIGDNISPLYHPIHATSKKLTPVGESEDFSLPPAVAKDPHDEQGHVHSHFEPRDRLDSMPLSAISQETEVSQPSTEGYDFYDTEALRKAIDMPALKKAMHEVPQDCVKAGSLQLLHRPLPKHESTENDSHLFHSSEDSHLATKPTVSSNDENTLHEHLPLKDAANSCQLKKKPSRTQPSSISKPYGQHSPNLSETTVYKNFPLKTQATTDSFLSRSVDMAVYPPSLKTAAETLPDLPVLLIPDESESELTSLRDTDYLPWPGDPRYPFTTSTPNSSTKNSDPSPLLDPYTLIARTLDFETQSSSVNAAAIILLLRPLLPEDVIDYSHAAAILRQLHTSLMGMRLFIEATLLRNLCVRGLPGIDMWGESYPAIFSPSQQGVKVSFMCSSCRRPRDVNHAPDSGDPGIWICDRCRAVNGPCAVCGHREAVSKLPPTPLAVAVAKALASKAPPSTDEQILSTWWYCPTCRHGGHSTCLQGWHGAISDVQTHPRIVGNGTSGGFSDGCCPLDGCGHPCLPGKWRNETHAARTEELGRQVSALSKGSTMGTMNNEISSTGTLTPVRGRTSLDGLSGYTVRGDWNDVPQSKAVETVREEFVRESIGSGSTTHGHISHGVSTLGGGSHSSAGGILSSSPSGRERRKSVKFAGDNTRSRQE